MDKFDTSARFSSARMIKGSIGSIAVQTVTRIMGLVVALTSVRVMAPLGVGTVAGVALVVGMVTQFSDFGLSVWAFQPGKSVILAGKLWIKISLVEAVVGTVLIVAINALWEHRMIIVVIGMISFANALISSLGQGRMWQMQKNREFGTFNQMQAIVGIVGGVSSIVMLLLRVGPLALVCGPLVGSVVGQIVILRKDVRGYFDSNDQSVTPEILAHCRSFMATYGSHYWMSNIDRWIVDGTLGAGALALYTTAFTLGRIVDLSLTRPIKQILLPVFVHLAGEGATEFYNKFEFRWTSILTLYWAGLLWSDPTILSLVFPPSWHAVILPIEIVSLIGVVGPFVNITGTVMIAQGHQDWVARYTLMRFLGLAVFTWPALRLFNLDGACVVDVLIYSCLVVPFILRKLPTAQAVLLQMLIPLGASLFAYLVILRVFNSVAHNDIELGIVYSGTYLGAIGLGMGRKLRRDISTLRATLASQVVA